VQGPFDDRGKLLTAIEQATSGSIGPQRGPSSRTAIRNGPSEGSLADRFEICFSSPIL
jgi:hypothetical protein